MCPSNVPMSYSLTPTQEDMLSHCLAFPRSGIGIEQVIGSFHESLDVAAFNRALQRVVDRHEVLRMQILVDRNGAARQSPLTRSKISVDELDWSDRPCQEQEKLIETFLKNDRAQQFDPSVEQMIRVTLFRLGESDYRIIFTWWQGILDGRARQILIVELFRFYDAFRQGKDLVLPLPRRFTEYTEWLASCNSDTASAYWKNLLEGFTEPTPVGTGKLLNSQKSRGFGRHEMRLPQAQTLRLREAAEKHGLTLDTLLQGAWALVLGQYSGESDVVFGTARACRQSAFSGDGTGDGIVGCLINTVPVRIKMPAERQLIAWLKDLQKENETLCLFENSSYFAVQACSDVPDDRRLFYSTVAYEDQLPDSTLRSQGGEWASRRFESRDQPILPLTANVYGEPDLLLRISNQRTHIDDQTAARMLDHLAVAIRSLTEQPEAKLAELQLLPEKDQWLLLEEWNRTDCPLPKESSIHHRFAEQAARTPDAPALTCSGMTWTYDQLDRRAEEIAMQLRNAGARPETVVGICMERCLDLVAGMLGILKAGAAYLPLDPSYPQDRLLFMIEDARPLLVVSSQSSRERITMADIPILSVDDGGMTGDSSAFGDHQGGNFDSHNLAYIIYTSGSTGKPKGVMVEHRNVLNLFTAMDAMLGREPGVSLSVISVSFDPSVIDLFWTLSRGYHVVIWPGAGSADTTPIPDLIREYGVTYLTCVPSFLKMIMMVPGGTGSLAMLRRMMVGGETLSPLLLRDLGPSIAERIVNAYGPTETTVLSTAWEVDPAAQSIPIGRPIVNTQIYVLDSYLRPVPVGVTGELYIGGMGVARGYLKRPELTDEKFIANPFSHTAGDRLYRTGDLVRYSLDGMLEFAGRIDDQVKIRGFRVELGEIDIVLNRHPDLKEAVVDIQDTAEGGKRLIAYVVPGAGGMPTPKELREWIEQELPVYMVPSAFVAMEKIPRTSNGKLDRKALPPPVGGDDSSSEEERTPTSLEANLMEVWCEVLHRKKVGLDENFFDLGGDSLMAVAMTVAIEERFGIKLSLADVFKVPTVARLAASMTADGGTEDSAPISPLPRLNMPPLSFGQEALWVHARLDPSSAVFNEPVGLRLRGALHLKALKSALDKLIQRHEALRTTFKSVGGEVCQVIADKTALPLQLLSVQDKPEHDRLRLAEKLASEEASRPFNLEIGPLVRATLVTLSSDDHLLVLVMHHIICDGRSHVILMRELGTIYGSELAGEPSLLPLPPIQYADFAIWQREHLTESRLAPHLDFWERQLAGAPPVLSLPTDRHRPAAQSYRGGHIPIHFDRSFVERLRGLSQRCGCTLFMTLMAGLQVLLARYLPPEERDIVIGFPFAGRTRRETEEVVGFFVNTLLLRANLSDDPTFRELLARVRRTAVAAYAHQELPFDCLVSALNPERTLSHNPLFQVVLALYEDVAEVPMPGLDVSVIPLHSGTAKNDLSVALDLNEEGGLTGFVEYATDLFDQCTVKQMVGHYRQLLESACQEPDHGINQLPILSNSEEHQLLVEWNDTRIPYPLDKTISQAFEEQVARTPDEPALTCSKNTWTYLELDRKAETIARHLRKEGARPETVIGICMERCLDLVAGMLAILKTGAAYLPLDPSYPRDRLLFMIEDARPRIVVSNHSSRNRLPATEVPVLSVDDDSINSDPASDLHDHQENNCGGHNLAYIIYTSGSTGKPKGVMVEHRNVMNLFAGMDAILSRKPGVSLAVISVSFDPSVIDLFWTLSRGYHVVIWPGLEGTSDTASIPELIRTHHVTYLQCVPSFLRMVMTLPGGTESLSTLQRIAVGGEALPPLLLRDLGPSISRRIVNAYGPTETTVQSTYWEVNPEAQSILIGRPFANTQIFVLDPYRHPVPIGVVGELYIGGAGVTRGYLNRPELMSEKFIANPFDRTTGKRLYRTGDLVRYRPGGMLEFIGRSDDQIKIRGFRVELGEIDIVLNKHPALKEAVVNVQQTMNDKKQLIGYVVPGTKGMPPKKELREWIGRELPVYMIPAAFVVLERIPRTSNGKLDRRALPPLKEDETPSPEVERTPTPLEAKLMEIWCEVLHRKKVGLDENFFDLGGDSLMAIAMIVAIEERFGAVLSLDELFNNQTIELIAYKLSGVVDAKWLDKTNASTGSPEHCTPRTETEHRIHAIWERLLKARPIGIQDHFFMLGGNPELFNQMLIDIRTTFDVFAEGLPISSINDNPTIEALARMIDESSNPSPSLVVCLQPQGSRNPLFLIHAGGGYVFFYRALATRLGPETPVYAVRAATSSDGQGRPFNLCKSIEEVAARYIAEIKSVQPNGPYTIGGACIGGIIAFEMARQLRSQGEKIAGPVLLFDSFMMNNPHLVKDGETSLMQQTGGGQWETIGEKITRHVRRILQLGLVMGIRYASGKIVRHAPSLLAEATLKMMLGLWRFPSRHASLFTAKPTEAEKTSNSVESIQRRVMEEFIMASARLQYKYVPDTFDGDIVLFKAVESIKKCDPEPLWAGLVREMIAVHLMPGDHLDMMEEPAVTKTASLVREALVEHK